jgi:hypothetical protein
VLQGGRQERERVAVGEGEARRQRETANISGIESTEKRDKNKEGRISETRQTG